MSQQYQAMVLETSVEAEMWYVQHTEVPAEESTAEKSPKCL